MKDRVFISFDYDHDEGAKIMLAGQAKLPDSPFEFKDASVTYHLTGDWKDKVRGRMNNIDQVIVLCGEKTHTAVELQPSWKSHRKRRSRIFC